MVKFIIMFKCLYLFTLWFVMIILNRQYFAGSFYFSFDCCQCLIVFYYLGCIVPDFTGVSCETGLCINDDNTLINDQMIKPQFDNFDLYELNQNRLDKDDKNQIKSSSNVAFNSIIFFVLNIFGVIPHVWNILETLPAFRGWVCIRESKGRKTHFDLSLTLSSGKSKVL